MIVQLDSLPKSSREEALQIVKRKRHKLREKVEALCSDTMKSNDIVLMVLSFLLLFTQPAIAYDPFAVNPDIKTLALNIDDAKRERTIPLLVYLPSTNNPQPVILFSHGLGGSRYGSPFLGNHWAGRNYVAVFLQHPGSDESVWKDKPMLGRMVSMKSAASAENFILRVNDVPVVLDQLAVWNGQQGNPLYGRLDLSHVGMSGHSFGAVTTQAVSGQQFPSNNMNFTDLRIKAAIAFSPSKPRRGSSPQDAFGSVSKPWMLMTGTDDNAPIGDADAKSRLEIYPALPAGSKYELVLNGAEHSAFTDRALGNEKNPRNPNHHHVILGLSTAFWDSYLRGDMSARQWLDGNDARSIMEPEDRWQHK